MRSARRSVAAACLVIGAMAAAQADDAALRFSAPIGVDRSAAFVQLPLPVGAYAHSLAPALQDLRVVDAAGNRVPFSLLEPRADESQSIERPTPTVPYALPSQPNASGQWASPVDVTVDGDRISVRRRGGRTDAADPKRPSAGWLFDLGERKPKDTPPQSLRLAWSGPAEFSAVYRLETSDDLRSWRAGGSGQVMALASASGPLLQAGIVLPAAAGRFVRLFWAEPSSAPIVTGANAIVVQARSVTLDAPSEIVVPALPASSTKDADDARALQFDLGAALPLAQIDLRLPVGTHVAPVRIQGRGTSAEAWRDITQGVFYRLEREGRASVSPPLAVRTTARFLRVLPDERAAPLDAASTQLAVQARLATLVFATQGTPPYALQAGALKASAGALPIATLVPALDEERARFGRATLGAWSEVAAVARAADAAQRQAALRPWLLWSVLLAGVAGLGFMVWRLTRTTPVSR